MTRVSKIIRGVALNWLALITTMVVAFLMSPFLVHRLGNTVYGVWILVVGAVSYMNLLDLGLRGAVARFVTKAQTNGDHQGASEAASAGLWLRIWICAVVAIGGCLLAVFFPRVWHVPPALETSASLAVLLVTCTLVITLAGGVFGAVLVALHRFDLQSSVQIGQTILRAAGTLWLVGHGHGIVAIAALELSVASIANCTIVLMALRVYPQLHLVLRRPRRDVLGKLWSFSAASFTILAAYQIIWYTDNLVVGSFVSASAVTFYAIGGSLVVYLRELVTSMSTTFTPLATSLDAEARKDALRQLLLQGTRAVLILTLPVAVALVIRGKTFITLWMGAPYGPSSGHVLQILVVAQVFVLANATSLGIAYGMARHRNVAVWAVFEAFANLALSVVLVRRLGINGVAWGTLIPSLIVSVFLWPPYICSVLQVSMWRYIRDAWIRTALPALPFAFACSFAEKYWPSDRLFVFLLQNVALLPLFLIPTLLIYRAEAWDLIRGWIEQRSAARVALASAST